MDFVESGSDPVCLQVQDAYETKYGMRHPPPFWALKPALVLAWSDLGRVATLGLSLGLIGGTRPRATSGCVAASATIDGSGRCRSRQNSGVGLAGRRCGRVGRPKEAGMEEEWRRKGATLSDKTARKEFGLTQNEIEAAIDAGQLQYRLGVIHGNPWLRLLRREVEELVESTYNDRGHQQRRAKAELARIDRDLKRLRAEVAALEAQRSRLLARLP